jgi:hypothetical protein
LGLSIHFAHIKVISGITGVTDLLTMLFDTVSSKESNADASQMYLGEAIREGIR